MGPKASAQSKSPNFTKVRRSKSSGSGKSLKEVNSHGQLND